MKLLRNFALTFALALLAVACKPTEKGYQQAYDVAKAKREYIDPDADLLTGGHKLLNDNSSDWVVVGNDSLQLQHLFISPLDNEAWPQPGPFHLAVAMFKMPTNAKSALRDINKRGLVDPVVASDGNQRYFIVAGSAPRISDLAKLLTDFYTANPGFRCIGLSPELPVVIECQ